MFAARPSPPAPLSSLSLTPSPTPHSSAGCFRPPPVVRSRRKRSLGPAPYGRPAHGTVQGVWTGSRLVQALSSLCACDVELSRLPGSGLHRQTKVYWRGNILSVNIWQTGRVHVHGLGAGDLARRLSSLPCDSLSQTAHAGSDTSGVGYHPLPETPGFMNSFVRWFRVFCSLVWHVLVFMPLRLRSFLGSPSWSKRHRRRKQIKGIGSQAAARRGARSRCIAIATLVQGKNQTFLSEFQTCAKPAPPEVLVHCCPFLGNLCLWGPLKRRSRGHLVAALDSVSGRAKSAAHSRVARWEWVLSRWCFLFHLCPCSLSMSQFLQLRLQLAPASTRMTQFFNNSFSWGTVNPHALPISRPMGGLLLST